MYCYGTGRLTGCAESRNFKVNYGTTEGSTPLRHPRTDGRTRSALQLILLQQQPLLGDSKLLLGAFGNSFCLRHSPPVQLQLLLQVLESVAQGQVRRADALWVGKNHRGTERADRKTPEELMKYVRRGEERVGELSAPAASS